MSPWVRSAAAAGCLCALAPAQQTGSFDFEQALRLLTSEERLWRAPIPGECCVQFSSHDPRSDAGPGDAAAWYANDDRGHYLRVVERDGTKEHVMVDVDGPGCLARLWSANPSGTLLFDVDGERVWEVDFALLCSGRLDGVPEPLAAMRSRGGNVHLPVPFGKHLTVSATAGDLYYLADVLRFPAGTPVRPFDRNSLARSEQALAAAAAALPRVDELGWFSTWPMPARIAAGDLVRGLTVHVGKVEDGADRLDVLRRTRLRIRCGRDDLVDVPLMEFFAGGQDWRPWRSRWLGITEQGMAYCYFPMPFPREGRITLVTDGGRRGVELGLGLSVKPTELPADTLLFRASYHLAKAVATRPFSDHLVLDATGRGRFVGCSLLVRNPTRIWWGEGDEKVWVDGGAKPSWFGTGTEDYFGYAWCDPTPFQAPLHAQVRCDGPMNYGFTQLFRAHALDAIPFQESLRFEFERWHWVEDTKLDYATVAYWYGAPGAKSLLPPVPQLTERLLEPLPPPKMFVADGVLEGETLRVVSCSGGVHEVQDLSFFEGRFSRDAHRWWRDGAVGDALVLAVPVADAGRYRVTLAMTRADDFGVVRATLAGKARGAPIDLYAEQVGPTGPIELGVVELAAGEQELRLELVGQNEKAKPRRMVGLDYVKLEKFE